MPHLRSELAHDSPEAADLILEMRDAVAGGVLERFGRNWHVGLQHAVAGMGPAILAWCLTIAFELALPAYVIVRPVRGVGCVALFHIRRRTSSLYGTVEKAFLWALRVLGRCIPAVRVDAILM